MQRPKEVPARGSGAWTRAVSRVPSRPRDARSLPWCPQRRGEAGKSRRESVVQESGFGVVCLSEPEARRTIGARAAASGRRGASPTFTLRLLGGFALEREHAQGVVHLPQRRAEALLAMLTLAQDLGCTRDRIVGLLWPDSDETHARHNLRDALHAIRAALGPAAVSSDGDTLRLDAAIVSSDVGQFAAALTASQLSTAVALYRGPLLDGFHVDDAPEFERWLDGARSRLARQNAAALERLAAEAEDAGSWAEAAVWWARAVEHDPPNSRLVLRHLQALAGCGDWANALRAAETHARRLREEFSLEPDPEFLAAVELIRRGELVKPADRMTRGARGGLGKELRATPGEGLMSPKASEAGDGGSAASGPVVGARRGRRRWMLRTLAAIAAMAVVGVLAWLLWPTEYVWELRNIRQLTHGPQLELYPVLSPDGREVAYTAGWGWHKRVYVRDVEGGGALALTMGHQGVSPMAWLPDGRRVLARSWDGPAAAAFLVARTGGPPEPIRQPVGYAIRGDTMLYQRADSLFIGGVDGTWESLLATAEGLHSAAWSPDGSRIAFVAGNYQYMWNTLGYWAPSSIWSVGVRGGPAVRASTGPAGAFFESPAWLPDSRHILLVSNSDGPRDLYVAHLGAGGHLLGGLRRLTTGLGPHTVSIAADGKTAVYSRLNMRANLYWLPVPHSGSVSIRQAHPVTSGNQLVVGDDVSRDGQWVTFDSNIEGRSNIYVMPVGGGEARRLTRSQGESWSPSFSPDGREIVFYSTRFGTRDVFLIRTDGTGEVRLTSDSGEQYNPRFSPDGLQVVYTLERGGERAVFVIRRDSIGGAWSAPTRLASDGGSARWSPDGRQLVYRSRRGISVLTQDGRSRGEVVLEREGRFLGDPSWSPDGRAIWYGATGARNGEAGLFEVPVMGGRSRMIVRLDDSTRAVGSFGKTVSGGKLYLIIWEFESNIYVADLKHR